MKVSVIIPVYNIADYVSYCIESLVCQDYKNVEIIIVDDGSEDKSPQICDSLVKKYNNKDIKVIHKQNGGLSSARNFGINVATGDYVMFVDGDDYVDNTTIFTLVSIVKNTKAEVIQYGYEEVQGYLGLEAAKNRTTDVANKGEIVTDRHEFYERLHALGGVAASSCTKFMPLGLVKSLLFKEGLLHEDEEFTTRLLAKCNSIVYMTNYTPYKYVMREGSIIHSTFKAKRTYDISKIYEERISVLQNLGYKDLVEKTASSYFNSLILHYGEAQKAKAVDVCKFIDDKAKNIVSKYNLRLSATNKIIAYIYSLNLSGAIIYYQCKNIVGK